MPNESLREQISQIREGLDVATLLPEVGAAQPKQPEPETKEPEPAVEEVAGEVEGEVAATGEEGEEGEEVSLFNELPEVMGWDPDQFYKLKLKTDTGKEYSWSEIKDALQSIDHTTAELTQKKTAIQQQEAELAKALETPPQAVSQEMQQAQGELYAIQARYNHLMDQIPELQKTEDLAGLTTAQAEIAQLQNQYGLVSQNMQQHQQVQHAKQLEIHNTYLKTQSQKLAEYLPEWSSETARPKLQKQITEYLHTQEVGPQEIAKINDARLLKIIHKAMLYDASKDKLTETISKAKGRTIRRIVAGSKPAPQKGAKLETIINTARESKSSKTKRAAIRAIGQNAGLIPQR